VIMNAKDLANWGNVENSSHKSDFMDTGDVGKWGKVDEATDDDLMLEVDFDIEEALKEDEEDLQKNDYTKIDIEFTGEIETALKGEDPEEKSN